MGFILKSLLLLVLALVLGLGFLFGTEAGGRFIVQKFFELEAHHLSMPCVQGEDCAHPEGRGDISRSKLGPNGPFSLVQLFIILRHQPWGLAPPDSFPTLFSLGLDSPWADAGLPVHTQFPPTTHAENEARATVDFDKHPDLFGTAIKFDDDCGMPRLHPLRVNGEKHKVIKEIGSKVYSYDSSVKYEFMDRLPGEDQPYARDPNIEVNKLKKLIIYNKVWRVLGIKLTRAELDVIQPGIEVYNSQAGCFMTGLDNSEWVPMANPKNPEIYEFLDALYDVGRSERGILKRCQAAVNGTIYQDEAEDVMKSIMWGTIFSGRSVVGNTIDNLRRMRSNPKRYTPMFDEYKSDFVRESMRLDPPVWCHEVDTKQDQTYEAFGSTVNFPKGAQMCPSLVVANRDPLVFGGADKTLYRALEFDPSRDNLDKMQIFAVQDSAIIAGNAPRGCPMRTFSLDLVTELVDYFKPSTDFSPVQPNYKTLHHKYGKLYKEHPDHEIWSYHGEPGKSSSAHLKTEL